MTYVRKSIKSHCRFTGRPEFYTIEIEHIYWYIESIKFNINFVETKRRLFQMTVSVRITHKLSKDIWLLKKRYAKSFLPCRDRKLKCALIKHLNVEKWGPHLSNRGSRTYMERVAACLLFFVFK